MNIFEGSRRIAKLIGACIAVGFLFVGITDRIEPVSVSYLWSEDGKTATRIDQCAVTDKDRTANQAKLAEVLKEKKISDLAIGKIINRSIFKEKFEAKTTSGRDVVIEHCADISAIFFDQSYTSANSVTKSAIENKYDIKGRCWAFSIKHTEANERDCPIAAIQGRIVQARAVGYDDTAIAQHLSSMKSEALAKLYSETTQGVKIPPGFELELKLGDLQRPYFKSLSPEVKSLIFDKIAAQDARYGELSAEAQKLVKSRLMATNPFAKFVTPAASEVKPFADPREELTALRRMAELEAQFAVQPQAAPFDPDAYLRRPAAAASGPWDAYQSNKPVKDGIRATALGEILTQGSPQTPVILESFKIPESDESYITFLIFIQFIKNVGQHLLNMVGSLAGLWFFTWVVGWIVRGFLGIPRGMDQKAPS
jgi:hypothetical protein